MLAELDAHSALVGVESTKYIAHPALLNNPFLKTLYEVAPDGPIVHEKLALSQPKLVFGSISSIEDKQAIERLSKQKFSVIWCNNHLENHPLGRTEWIIAFGWVMGKASAAQTLFDSVQSNYEQIAAQAKKAAISPPKVIANCAYNGVWFIPQNASYVAQLIRDAGGEPITVEMGAGSNVINLEKAITLFRDADIWINTDLCNTLRCLEQSDPRIVNIKAFKNRRAYHFNKQLQPNGSNPYWDMGCIYPNKVLSDLFHIVGNTHRVESAHYYDICK
jgi:iron complex transport system substrate-binding protein